MPRVRLRRGWVPLPRRRKGHRVTDQASFYPVTQTEFSNEDGSVHGNCLSACLEAITGEKEIPNFANYGRSVWFMKLWAWGDEHGWEIHSCNRDRLPPGAVIVQGKGPRGFQHACVWVGGPTGMIAWDPHPDRTGLTATHWIRVSKAEPSSG